MRYAYLTKKAASVFFVAGLIAGLVWLSQKNFLLFHTLTEFFSIFVGLGVFFVAWTARRFLDNPYFKLLAVGFLCFGTLDLIHTLAFKGMGVFPHHQGVNLSAQLWIAGRYIQTLSFIAAWALVKRKLQMTWLVCGFTVIFALILMSIFVWGNFPQCYDDQAGVLTPFKIFSEYIIIGLLAVALGLLIWHGRRYFSRQTIQLLAASIFLTIASEFAFTLYQNIRGNWTVVGHLFKIVAFYLIYKAIIELALRDPYKLLFSNLKQSQNALQNSERRYRNVVEDTPAMISRFLPDGTLTYVNKARCDAAGLKRHQLIGRNFLDFLAADTREEVIKHINSLTKQNPVLTIEQKTISPDGNFQWQVWTDRALFDRDGKTVEYQAIGQDITEFKLAEEKLRESEARYRAIVEDQTELICRNLPDKTLTFANEAYCRYFGKNQDELIGKSFIPLIPQIDQEAVKQYFDSLTPDNPVGTHEHRVILADGEVRWHRWTNRLIFDDAGQVVETQGAGRDITESKEVEQELQKAHSELEKRVRERTEELAGAVDELQREVKERSRAENALRESELRYRRLVEQMPAAVYTANAENRGVTYISPQIETITGYSPDDHMENPHLWMNIIHPDDQKIFDRPLPPVSKAAEPIVDEYRVIRKDGETIWVRSSVVSICNSSGERVAFQGIIVDITEAREAVEALWESEDRFASFMQHLPGAAYIKDDQGRHLYVNEYLCEIMMGLKPEDVLGKRVSDFWPKEIAEKMEANDRHVLETGQPYEVVEETEIAGQPAYHIGYKFPIFRTDQSPLLGGISINITERRKAEQKAGELTAQLEQQSRLMDTIVNAAEDHFYVFDPDCRYVYVSYEAMEALGVTAEQIIGKTWQEAGLVAEILEPFEKLIRKVFATGESITEEVTYPMTMGDRDYVCNLNPVEDPGGNIRLVVTTVHDVTIRNQAAQALRESDLRFRTIVETFPGMIRMTHNDPQLTPIYISDSAADLFGYSKESLLDGSVSFTDLLELKDQDKMRMAISKALDRGEHYEIEMPFTRADGQHIWVQEIGAGVYDDSGQVEYIITTSLDITERKKAQELVQAERHRLFSVLNVLPGFVTLVTKDHQIRYANHTFLELFGEPSLQPCYKAQMGRDKPCLQCQAITVLETDTPADWEWTDTKGRKYHIWSYPFKEADGTDLVLQLGIDITKQARLEKQVIQTSEMERRRIGRDLHDTLGQELTGLAFLIKGLSQKLSDQLPDQKKTAKQLVDLVNNAVAQVRSLARGLNPVGLHEGGLVAALVELAGNIEQRYPIACHCDCDENLEMDNEFAATNLYYIAQEAVNNAIKHAGAKEIRIRLHDDKEAIYLEIRDDGVGIPPETEGNVGMGLHIMGYRAKAIGGSLTIGPVDGKGTSIKCIAPHRGDEHLTERILP